MFKKDQLKMRRMICAEFAKRKDFSRMQAVRKLSSVAHVLPVGVTGEDFAKRRRFQMRQIGTLSRFGILLFLTAAISIATPKHPKAKPVIAHTFTEWQSGALWRFSVDQKVYSIENVAGRLVISPVGTGSVSAVLPIKVDKKGREKAIGIWEAEGKRGFMMIEQVTAQSISAFRIEPLDPSLPNACLSRTAAILANISLMNENRLACDGATVQWMRDESVTAEAAAHQEIAASEVRYTPAPSVFMSSESGSTFVGTWQRAIGDRYNNANIVIVLNADGTYDKLLTGRMGGVGASPVGGVHELGTWHSSGTTIYTSGNGSFSPNHFDIRSFQQVR